MHIAVARRVPAVAVFCATTPDLGFYPYTSNAIVLGKNLLCRPCGSHGGRRCPLGSEDCIRQIQPEKVLEAVDKLFAADRSRRDPSAHGFYPEFVAV
jgi:heptosyltransferase-2